MSIYDYLNQRNLNKTMSDEQFEAILTQLVFDMYNYGFSGIVDNYNSGIKSIIQDWDNLKKKKVDINYINSTSTTGLCIIKRHMPHIYDVKNFKGKCVRDLWTEDNIKKVLILNRKTHSTPYVSEIIRQLGFMAGTSKVTIYRPLLTKRIVEYFNSKNVLDVCVGWGGRMLGAASVPGVKYTGIEPFSKTFNGLEAIRQELSLENVTLYNDTAEHILPLLEEKYDLALTSPPYYNLEIYSDEDSQSHHYGSYENWYENFLKPVVYGVLERLTDDGYSCWSVKNFKTDKQYNLYDDIVKLHREKGWEKIEVEFYVGNCLRPGLKDKNGKAKKSREITYAFIKENLGSP